MDIKEAVIVLLWVLFLNRVYRAVRTGRISHAPTIRLGMTFFLALAAFSFWGEDTEQQFDRFFFGYPVAVYLKYIFLIWSGYLYYQVLRDVHGTQRPVDRYLLMPLAPVATIIGLLTFLAFIIWQPLPASEWRYLVIGARDFVVLIYVLLSLIPDTVRMIQKEQIIAMRVKQIAIVLCASCFAITSVSSIGAAVLKLNGAENIKPWALALQPIVYAGGFFFLVMLIPFSWYSLPLQLYRVYVFFRLKRVNNRILAMTGAQQRITFGYRILIDAGELELMIYRLVISVLEKYRALPAETEMYQAIHHRVKTNTDYNHLVRELARL